jgi:hypothetical protein
MKKNLFLVLCFFMMDLSSAFAQQLDGQTGLFFLPGSKELSMVSTNCLSL